MVALNAFPIAKSEDPDLWRAIPVDLGQIALDEATLADARESALEYACMESFGLTPEELQEDHDAIASDHITLTFEKAVQVGKALILAWSFSDSEGTWSDAILLDATWDRPPLKTKGGLTTASSKDGLTVDQNIWRFFHQDLADDINLREDQA